jgi:hypothetical protein
MMVCSTFGRFLQSHIASVNNPDASRFAIVARTAVASDMGLTSVANSQHARTCSNRSSIGFDGDHSA